MPSGSEQQRAGEKMSPIVKRVAILRTDLTNRKQRLIQRLALWEPLVRDFTALDGTVIVS